MPGAWVGEARTDDDDSAAFGGDLGGFDGWLIGRDRALGETERSSDGKDSILRLSDALGRLKVARESRRGYERDKFRLWTGEDHDGCDTRKEALLAEAVKKPRQGKNCKLTGGSWHSHYDDKTVTDARKLDIDHVVPLAEAWDSGASTWTLSAHNHGMNDIVEAAWHKILATVGEPIRPEGSPLLEPFTELVRVALTAPQLRQLYPWTGMWELHFSRCTEFRPTWDIPYIGTLGDGRYYVEGPSRNSPRIAETDSPQTAVALVIERLPAGCGPAFVGSAEELAAYERGRDRR